MATEKSTDGKDKTLAERLLAASARAQEAEAKLTELREWLSDYGISDTSTGTRYVKIEVIAAAIGLSARRVRQLAQDGIIDYVRIGRVSRFDYDETLKKYIAYLSANRKTEEQQAKTDDLKNQKLKAEVKLKQSQAELHKIRKDSAAGRYVDRQAVSDDYEKFFGTFKRFALSLPARAVGMLSDKIPPEEGRAAELALTEEVRRLLNAFVIAATGDGGADAEGEDDE